MITRVYRGHNTPRLLAYLYGPGRHEEHTDQHLVTCWDGNPALLEPAGFDAAVAGPAATMAHARAIGMQLDEPVAVCETVPDYTYHLVLRAAPTDPVLSDEQWAGIARDAMDRTGIAPAGDDGGCRWVLVRHGADHVHLVATLARQDGVRPRLSRDFDKLRAVAADWEARLGLLRTARQDATAAPGPTIGETKRADREAAAADRARRRGRDGGRSSGSQRGGPAAGPGGRTGPASGVGTGTDPGGRAKVETARQRLARAVHAAAAGVHDLASFEAALAHVGVEVWRRESTTQPGQVTGLSFSLRGHTTRDGDPIRYGGGTLAPDLTWPKLRARWAGANDADKTRSTSGTRPGSRPATSPSAATAWQDAEQIVREAAERIRTIGLQDPDGTADAVWAAADVLRSLADAMDGDARGPLTAAADDLARAARHTHRQVPTPTDGGRALRHLARTVAMLARRSRRPEDQVLALIVSLASLSRTIAATRTAQDRLWQARSAQLSADRLASIRAGDLRPSAAQMAAAQQATPEHWARGGRAAGRPAGPVSPPRPGPGPEPRRSRIVQ